ncbi:Acetyl-coenzyme A synthetase [Frankliniella fusca]|uniref:Acetyl-coenzyme A synthetase n=1 Tax=Frankliniella fusca TaxID=407009 RepID=A0AAE1GXJ0_9NEOP|nr:Acetyl-coenzyme A synthetase [Frankliniella fusca]
MRLWVGRRGAEQVRSPRGGGRVGFALVNIHVLAEVARWAVPCKHSGNLEKHIRRNHKDRVALLDKEIEKCRQLRLVQKEKKAVLKVAMTPWQLKLACVRLVAVHGRPFKLMADEAFHDIVDPIIAAFPARQRLKPFPKWTRKEHSDFEHT